MNLLIIDNLDEIAFLSYFIIFYAVEKKNNKEFVPPSSFIQIKNSKDFKILPLIFNNNFLCRLRFFKIKALLLRMRSTIKNQTELQIRL